MTACRPPTDAALDQAAQLLAAGEVVALPTETVYGLAADATRPEAIRRIYEAKERPLDNPLIVHVGRDLGSVQALVERGWVAGLEDTPARAAAAQRLIERFWPGPLTLVLPRGPRIAPDVSAGLPTVGLRMPANEVFLELLGRLAFPLAAPSANRANRISPTSAADVLEELEGRIPLVLDGGPTHVGLESTVVYVEEDGGLLLLRPGGLPAEAVEEAAGVPVERPSAHAEHRLSPGRRPVHYAPRKRLVLCRAADDPGPALGGGPSPGRVAVLLMAGTGCPPAWRSALSGRQVELRSLGDAGDGARAAQALFAALRALDAGPSDVILAERPDPDTGLWPAIADRLGRAAAGSG